MNTYQIPKLFRNRPGKSWLLASALTAILLLPIPTFAFQFEAGDLQGSLDSTLSYGAAWRVDGRDPDLIGRANKTYNGGKGNAYSVNGDDGNLNYDKGDLISNAAKITSDLALKYHNFGIFLRGTAFYDFENNDGERARTQLTDDALDMVGTDVDLLDAYLTWNFSVADMPAQIRLGDQVISWGESTFIQNSINSINPVDVSKIRVPGAELKEALIPVGIASASVSPTENITFEAFYQYDWEETAIDPTGSYWSTNDFAGKGGRKVMLGWGDTSDLGTSLAALGALRPFFGVDAFESEFLSVSRMADVEASDDGQYGVALRVFAPRLNDTEFGFYFMNYHSRLPIISAKTGTTAAATARYIAAAATALPSPPFPAATTPFAALSGAIGAAAAQQTLGGILINEYAETAHYFIEYPEDIKLYGISFNTLLNVTGTAIQGEYSFRQDAPLQVDDVELLLAALSPLEGTPMGGLFLYDNNQLGTYGENTIIHGYRRLDVSQAQVTATQTFGPTLGADQFVMAGEVGITHVHDMPSKSSLRMEAPGTYVSGNPIHAAAGGAHASKPAEPSSAFADATSWGYRMVARMDFNNAIGAVTLSPRIAWAHDVSGTTPGPGGNFIEDRKAITLGLGADYQNTWSADLSYTEFFGAGRYNLVNDRDFVALNIKYSF